MPRNVKSAERTLEIFELFSSEQRSLTLGEISKRLSIPLASASMLLSDLSRLGYLSHNFHERTYLPTIRLVLLGGWMEMRHLFIGGFAIQLSELQAKFRLTACIGAQNGSVVQYVFLQDPIAPNNLLIQSSKTLMVPLTYSAGGRVLLSLKPDDEVAIWIRRANAEAADSRYRLRESEIMNMVRNARRDGYADSAGILNHMGNISGGIAVAIPAAVAGVPLAAVLGGAPHQVSAHREEMIQGLKDLKDRWASQQAAPRI